MLLWARDKGKWAQLSPLTQEFGDDVKGLSPKKQLSVAATVARKSLLTARVLFLVLYKVRWHIVVLGYDRVTFGV